MDYALARTQNPLPQSHNGKGDNDDANYVNNGSGSQHVPHFYGATAEDDSVWGGGNRQQKPKGGKEGNGKQS